MGALFPESVPVMHFNAFSAPTASGTDPKDLTKYSAVEQRLLKAREEFSKTGMGYFMIQNTKVSGGSSFVS